MGWAPALALAGGELADPIAEALPAGGMAHPAHGPGEALPTREVVVHGSLSHPQGGLGLPLPLREPDLPMLQAVLVPGPERMPRRVAELGNGVCRARVELDVGPDCQLALLCVVHAVLRTTFSWSRITTAVPIVYVCVDLDCPAAICTSANNAAVSVGDIDLGLIHQTGSKIYASRTT